MQRPFVILTFFYLTFVQAVLGFSHDPSKRMVKTQHRRAASPTAGVDMNSELSLWNQHASIVTSVKSAMLASIRTRCVFWLRASRNNTSLTLVNQLGTGHSGKWNTRDRQR